MSDGVCNAFQILAASVLRENPGVMFKCEMPPTPVEALPAASADQHRVVMKGAGATWPTGSVDECLTRGAGLVSMRTVPAGHSITESGMQCLDSKNHKTLAEFEVTKACAPGKDPQKPGNCETKPVNVRRIAPGATPRQ